MCMGVARVNGVLAVARAFGNRMLRDVIRPDAEVRVKTLTSDDHFLLLASDGLFDVMTNQVPSSISKKKKAKRSIHVLFSSLPRRFLRCATNYVLKVFRAFRSTLSKKRCIEDPWFHFSFSIFSCVYLSYFYLFFLGQCHSPYC